MENAWLTISYNESALGKNWTIADDDSENATRFNKLFHQPIDLVVRISVLWILAVLGVVGNFLVLLWISAHRKCRSRINLLILHLTVADFLVIGWATCPQLAWEYAQRQWEMSDLMCRLFKFLQTAAISVSNYMVVVLAIDRYFAIRRPLKKALSVSCMAGVAWTLAVTLNAANILLYEKKEIQGDVFCRNILYDYPEVYMQAYITMIAVMVVIVPFFLICIMYGRIFQKISRKASESIRSTRSSVKPGKIHLQATKSSTLPKAKVKTFKMTIVIVLSFLLCSTPYFVCDIWRVYKGQSIPSTAWAILGALAVSNSSTNSFVFLGFNSTSKWWKEFFTTRRKSSKLCDNSGGTNQTQSDQLPMESLKMSMPCNGSTRKKDTNPEEAASSPQPPTSIEKPNAISTMAQVVGNSVMTSKNAGGKHFAL